MCYASGSIDQAVNPCPMCKVFPHARCPHVRETCRNRAMHPRMDVLYLKNAEVDRFNGCGYCKWARSNPTPPAEFLRYNNPGWPGCCRAPFPTEYRSIPAAEWRAVSTVHQITIPSDIKAVLDSLSSRGSALPPIPSASPTTRASARPGNDRKNSGGSSPSSKTPNVSARAIASPSNRGRSGGSPQTPSATLSRTSSGNAISSSVPAPSNMEHHLSERRLRNGGDTPVHSSHSSPSRKNVDLDHQSGTPRRVSSMRRPTVTPATTSVSVSKVVADSPSPSASAARRKSSISKHERRELPALPIATSRTDQRRASHVNPPPLKAGDDNLSSASSSSGSSDGLGSMSDNTVTSDGGFTDYLSDESEAELQRQAEARAAVLALNMEEELEFKAARLQLAHVDLRPPKSWNPTNITNTSSPRALARVGQTRG